MSRHVMGGDRVCSARLANSISEEIVSAVCESPCVTVSINDNNVHQTDALFFSPKYQVLYESTSLSLWHGPTAPSSPQP